MLLTIVARGDFPLEQVKLNAGLELAQGRDARVRLLIRHAPTGLPLDRRTPLHSQQRAPDSCREPTIRVKIRRPFSTLPLIV